MPEKPDDGRVNQFADYLVENYIDEESTFPPIVWAEKTASLLRTTNACESFHSKFNSYCPSPHPNLFIFLNCLKSMQTDTYVKINSVNSASVKKIRKEIIEKQKFITDKIEQLGKNYISRLNYIKCVSHKFSSGMF